MSEAQKGELVREQIDRLVRFIMDEVPGEPSRSEGAVDTAIRAMRDLRAEVARLNDGNHMYHARMRQLEEEIDRLTADRDHLTAMLSEATTREEKLEAEIDRLSDGVQIRQETGQHLYDRCCEQYKKIQELEGEIDRRVQENIDRTNERNEAREALREIAKGEGRFSRDHLEHAENTIEDMKALANAALGKEAGKEGT